MAHSRVERVRARLGEADGRNFPLHFCAGVVALSSGEDPTVALKAADAAMYAAKPAAPSSGEVRPATRTAVQPIV
jgi:GGDEF domain-containing protein